MMIVSARPTMKPFSTGSEMKFATNPRRSRPASSAASPVVIASAAVIADEAGAADRDERGDRRRRQRGGGGHRAGDELARAAERGVEDQRAGRRVQAHDRGDAGDRGVGERLGHEHRPDRQPGDEVAAQRMRAGSAQRGKQPPHRRQTRCTPHGLRVPVAPPTVRDCHASAKRSDRSSRSRSVWRSARCRSSPWC